MSRCWLVGWGSACPLLFAGSTSVLCMYVYFLKNCHVAVRSHPQSHPSPPFPTLTASPSFCLFLRLLKKSNYLFSPPEIGHVDSAVEKTVVIKRHRIVVLRLFSNQQHFFICFSLSLCLNLKEEVLQCSYTWDILDARISPDKTPSRSSCKYSFKHAKTKRRPLYLKTQSVPRFKHFSSRL